MSGQFRRDQALSSMISTFLTKKDLVDITTQDHKEEGKNDVEDIEDMLKSDEIDTEYLRERVLKCHAADAVYPLLRRLGAI